MPNVVSNPLFQVIVLFLGTSGLWFVATDETTEIKKKVLSFASDVLYYFILTSFGLNLLLNFREIINEPYRALRFSSETYWIASLAVMAYLVFQIRGGNPLKNKHYEQLVDLTLNYLFLLGLFNHLFYYYKYRSINSVIFILVYFLFYLFKDRIKHSSKNELALLALGLLHGLVMYSFSRIIIYYQIVFIHIKLLVCYLSQVVYCII